MENIRYAVRVFAFRDNKVICIRYKNHDKNFYDIPGGKIETGESEIQTCIREFKEETGIDIDKLHYIGKTQIYDSNKKFIIKTYIAYEINGEPKEFEENYSEWISINELTSNEKRFAVTHLLDNDLIDYFNKENLNIIFTCGDNHKIIDMKLL